MIDVTVSSSVKKAPTKKWCEKVAQAVHDVVPKSKKKALTKVAVFFVGEQKMKSLNGVYHGSYTPTDVLAFESQIKDWPRQEDAELGDVVLCLSYIDKQARRFDVPAEQERKRILAHGLLHLLAYDHKTKSQAAVMFGLQEKALESLT